MGTTADTLSSESLIDTPLRSRPRMAVLGASGQIGSMVVQRLVIDFPEGEIIACFRTMPASLIGGSNVTPMVFDPFADSWEKLGKIDVLINSIGIIAETPGLTFAQAHQGLTQRMLQNRKLLGNPKLIQISVLGATVDNTSAFFRTKALADEHLLSQPRTLVIRPSIVCTPNTVMVQKLRMLSRMSRLSLDYLPFPAGLAHTHIMPIMGEDLAKLISRLCAEETHPELIYAVGPKAISLRELIGYSRGGRVKAVLFPQKIFDTLFPLVELFLSGLLNREQLAMLQKDNTADPTIIQQILGQPLTDTIPFWKEELAV